MTISTYSVPPISSTNTNMRIGDSFVFVRSARKVIRFDICDISHIESAGNYVKIHSRGRVELTISTMKRITGQLPANLFFQANRGTIVNKSWISSFDKNSLILLNGVAISFGEGRFKALLEEVPIL